MRIAPLSSLTLVLALGALAPPARAQFAALETDDLRLVYINPTMAFVTPHTARCFENSMGFQRRLFGYEPSEKVSVLLLDLQDSGNASAGAVPRNSLNVQLAPLHFTFETMLANERMNTLMNHELVHIATNDKPGSTDRFFRGLFQGKVSPIAEQPESILYFYLTNPRIAAPRWYHEGIAVFVDTWMAGGLGRAQGAYDEMVFRSMVRDGSRFYDPLGLASEGTKIDFQTETNSYLYGTRFMSWLASHYSPETLVRWFTRGKGSHAYYSSDFRRVFGTSLDAAWGEWVKHEHAFQQKNLEAIRQYPTTPYKDISKQALGSISRGFVDPEQRTLYAALNYPGIVGHVAAISLADGSVAKLRDVKQPRLYAVSSVAFDPDARMLFYTTDNVSFRDIVALDPRTKKTRVLLKDARIGDLVFSRADRSLWGIRIYNGACTLVRIPHPYKEWKQVFTWPYGEVVYDLDVSPDGKFVSFTHAAIDGKQSVHVLSTESLSTQSAVPLKQFDFGTAIPQGFVFSPDGRYLYGSSYYTGAANIFRYEIETGALEAVSNTETGFFRPIPLGGDELLVFRYTGEGFVPTRIEAKPLQDVSAITFFGQEIAEAHPVLKDWKVGSPAEVPLDSMVKRDGPYRSFGGIGLESLYPVVQGYKDGVAPGLRFNFSDPLNFNNIALSASYSVDDSLPGSERFHGRLDYRRYDWSASARYNPADFYDLFGPTKTSRKGYAFGLGYDRTLVWDTPRTIDMKVRAEYWGDLEELPDYQGVATTSDKLFTSSARLHGRYVRNSLGYVDDEKGREWDVVVSADVADGQGYFTTYADLDFGFALPLRHSSVWLRNSAGLSPGDIEQPYSNFFFGGFGNNWVDHKDEKRYRAHYAFPGVEINEISGRNYVKSMLEWNLPPIRFRRVGTPGFHVTWARPALFASGLVTNLDDTAIRRELVNAGGQLDFRFTLLSRLDMTLSGGYAVAFEKGLPPRREWMASLKVLR
ncbi:MAG TPA: hypothetical protein VKA01_05960 [Vicinamibacteria bacterium]|nr:hypothetical protein [Vicinamibacteria bacterium]